MKITTEKYLLNSLHNLKNYYPGIFDLLDKARIDEDKTWPDYVYYPRMSIWKQITSVINPPSILLKVLKRQQEYDNSIINNVNICESAVTFYNWRRNKKIYRVSDELTDIICNIADNADRYSVNISFEKFFNIDINGIFVQSRISDNIYGFYVVLDYYMDHPEIIFYFIDNKCDDDSYTKNVFVGEPSEFTFVDGKSIGECMDFTTGLVNKAMRKLENVHSEYIVSKFNDRNDISKADRSQMRALAILSYILDGNSDIKPNPVQAKIYRKPDQNYIIKDKFREIQSFDVGFGFTNSINQIRKVMYNPSVNSSNTDNIITDTKCNANDYENEIERLKRHIAKLSAENESMSKQLSNYDKRYNSLIESVKSERRELYDLRELVFNSQNNNETECINNTTIVYPYCLKRKTVVIGGTNPWANAIKAKFNNVKVIDGLSMPNDDLIKYANIIWIQVDCMKHKHYYKIINIARSYNIPVRYFTYKGIMSCCNQLVENDINA